MNRRANFIYCVMIAISCIAAPRLSAQLVNSDTLIYPLNTAGQTFENYLVSLAWENNPEYKIYASKLNIAQSEIAIAKRAWADDWSITLNLNENNLQTLEGTEPILLTQDTKDNLEAQGLSEITARLETAGQEINVNNFPRYNFGLALNLGSLLTRGKEVNIAEQNLIIEEFSRDQEKMDIRSEVYRAYAEYNQAIKLLKIRTKSEQNQGDMYDLMKSRFKAGSVKFDELGRAEAGHNRALEDLNNAEVKVALARLAIEELIAIPLSLAKYHYEQTNGL